MNKSQILEENLIFSYLESKQLVILNKLSELKLVNYKPFYEEFVMNSGKSVISNSEKNISKIQIIIVNGSNCSGKTRFVQNLLRFEQEFTEEKLHFLSLKPYEIPSLNEGLLLIKLLDFAISNKITPKGNIIFVIQPARLNIVTFIDLLEKNVDFSSKFCIKCVITKVNINNIYENFHKQFVKKLLLFGAYSQFLILDSYGNTEIEIDHWNSLIKASFPTVNLYRIMNNIVSLGVMKDIMRYSGFYDKKARFERLRNRVFCDIPDDLSQKSDVFIAFHMPIFREKLTDFYREIMRKNEGFLYKKWEIPQEERKKAEKSKDLLAIELLKLKGILRDFDQKYSRKTPHIINIKAFVRFSTLEEGIWEITMNSNYYIERLVKNVKTRVYKEKLSDKLEIQNVSNEGMEDLKVIGFLFHGENLVENKLLDLLRDLSLLKVYNIIHDFFIVKGIYIYT